jgi:nucleoside-diphosphate-sugar epimerase
VTAAGEAGDGKLTVAVTGPTGDVGRTAVRVLEARPEVGRIIGMARRPFDPAEHGWQRTEYRRGDILDRASVEDLVAEADVVVHLAFIIFGDHEEAHRVNLEGSRNVFEATAAAGAKRLVYTSSVAAYGFEAGDRGWITEDMPAAGSDSFYYSAHKAELEQVLADSLAESETDAYVLRPSVVAGADAPTLIAMITTGNRLTAALAPLRRGLEKLPLVRPVIPDTGVPFQLVHTDDVAAAVAAAVAGEGSPGIYNLAAPDEITTADLARELGWATVPVPKAAVSAVAAAIERAPLTPAIAEWINAFRTPVLMDSSKASRELGIDSWRSGAETLTETVAAARKRGLL